MTGDALAALLGPDRALRQLSTIYRIDGHVPHRPDWTCARDCGEPWPCTLARVHIAAAYRRDQIGLSLLMSVLTPILVADLGEGAPDPVELHERFVAWTR